MVKVCYFARVSPSFALNFAGRNLSPSFARHTASVPLHQPAPAGSAGLCYSSAGGVAYNLSDQRAERLVAYVSPCLGSSWPAVTCHEDDYAYSEYSVPSTLDTCFHFQSVRDVPLEGADLDLINGSCHLLQALNALQNEELVAAVLGHIDSLRDLLRCSAVNKCWQSASQALRPTSITIPGVSGSEENIDCDGILQWLQQKHQQQYFARLQNMSVSLAKTAAAIVHDDMPTLAAFGVAILTLAGLWPLKVCSIDGPLDVHQIAALLPQTLHHLHVKVYTDHLEYSKIDICIFQRLRSLRSLRLSAAQRGPITGVQMQSPMALPNLRHLYVSPWAFKDNGMLANSLPQLSHVALRVHATDFKQYIKLPHIDYLGLVLINMGNEAVQLKVKVDADSHLNCLVLNVPENVKLDLCLDKPNLLYKIRGSGGTSGGICCVRSPASLKKVYQLPKHFHAL